MNNDAGVLNVLAYFGMAVMLVATVIRWVCGVGRK